MNYTQTFEEFSSKLSTMDLALYAGLGIVIYVLFKDRLSPVQSFLGSLLSKVKNISDGATVQLPAIANPVKNEPVSAKNSQDNFFKLVASWKQTRDLAQTSGCTEAVKAIDQMFPYLSPQVCSQQSEKGDNK